MPPAKVDKILVKRDRSDIVRFMKVFVSGSYGPNACGGIVELMRSSPGEVGVHVQEARYICRLFLMR
jgi:hypothetical protein